MKNFALVSTFLFILHLLSTQTVQAQDRTKHPLNEGTVSSSLEAYSKWKGSAMNPQNPSLVHKAVAAVTKRLDTQTGMVDLTIATSDLFRQGSPELVVELQPFKYRIAADGAFSRQSLGKRTQLDLPTVNQLRNAAERVTNRALSFVAPQPINGVEIIVRFSGGQERSSITILMPLEDQDRSWVGGQVFQSGIVGNYDSNQDGGFAVTKVLFGRTTTPFFDGCREWTLTCGSCTIKVSCSNNDPSFNCVNCTYSNCTECQVT